MWASERSIEHTEQGNGVITTFEDRQINEKFSRRPKSIGMEGDPSPFLQALPSPKV